MDNRFLFRGKWLVNGELVIGFLTSMWGQMHIIKPDDENSAYSIDPATISQCTGIVAAKSYRGEELEDRLIFEGDICRSIDGVFLVTWDDEKAAFIMRFEDEPEFLYIEEMQDDTKIIGNIYDDLDLLEVIND